MAAELTPIYPTMLHQPVSITAEGQFVDLQTFLSSPDSTRTVDELSSQELLNLVCYRLSLGRHPINPQIPGRRLEDYAAEIQKGTPRGQRIVEEELSSLHILGEAVRHYSVYLVEDNQGPRRK